MDKHVIPALLIITGIIALTLVGGGITGMVTGEKDVRSMCAVDSHCSTTQVCCMVDSQIGVCGHEGYCPAVVEGLSDEQDAINYINSSILVENKAALGMMLGMALMLLIVSSFHFVYPSRRVGPGDEDDEEPMPPLPEVPEEEEESEESSPTARIKIIVKR